MKENPQKSNFSAGNWRFFLWLFAAWLLIVNVIGLFTAGNVQELTYSEFKRKIENGQVAEVVFDGDQVRGTLKAAAAKEKEEEGGTGVVQRQQTGEKRFTTVLPSLKEPALLEMLEKRGVTIKAESQKGSVWGTLLISMLPWLLLIAIFVYSNKKMREGLGGKGGPFSFGKSKAKLYAKDTVNLTFRNVAGLENAKKEFQEIIDFLKNPDKYTSLGGELPKGVLLVGPPGTGKTLMARATAGEAGVPFYSISGSEFIEMFVGVGASRVRNMFDDAKKNSPAIIFIDEIDSIGRVRGTGLGGGHDEREQTLNQILAEMDGFSARESVIVMAATNRPDVLDPALVRPGRFDRQVTLDLPQKEARYEILKLHASHSPLADDVNLERVAEGTVGFSGADLKNLVNEAVLLAARKNKKIVEMVDFDEGRDKIILGLEKEDHLNDEEKRAVAYHEAGHALVALLTPGADPLKKVTIIPRGRALGVTEQVPNEDLHNLRRDYLLGRLRIMLGGHAAEYLVYEDVSTGAGDDLKKATALARRMVCQWGMSDRLGPVFFSQGENHPFLGRELAREKNFSEETARIIDEEIRGIVHEAKTAAGDLLKENRHKLDLLAENLQEKETLTDREIESLLEEK